MEILLVLPGLGLASQVGHLQAAPYSVLASTLLPDFTYQSFQTYQDLSSCLSSTCDYILVPDIAHRYFPGLPSHPLLTDRLITITKDERGDNFQTILWQFLVLLATIWLPGVLLISQAVYFLEIRQHGRPSYVYGSLLACWATFNLSKAKRDSMKVCLALSWLFLAFLLLIITLDLSSSHTSVNSQNLLNSLQFHDQTVCTTQVNST